MRVHFLSPDSQNRTDGTIHAHLLSGFPDVSSSPHDCDVIIVPITTFPDYKFNPKLLDIKKPWALLDYTELEWNYFDLGNGTMLFGKNAKECRWLNPHWHPLDDFARDHPPVVYFKRELLEAARSDTVHPCDWPCRLEIPPLDTENQFNARVIEVAHVWGFSNPARPRLHAAIFNAMTTHGIGVISEIEHFHDYFKNPSARTWASIFAPHYARRPISSIEWLQQRCKMSVSLPGCGTKSFRDSESSVGTIMALHDNDVARSYPWIDGANCIRLTPGREFEDLNDVSKRNDLFSIYCRGQETIANLQTKRYVEHYVSPLIEARL